MYSTRAPARPAAWRLLAVVLALPCWLGACGGGGGPAPEEEDLPPFFLAASTPTDGSVGVALAQTILVRFNKALDPGSVNAASLSVRSVSGAPMAGTVTIQEGGAGDTLRWIPIHDLASGEQHICEVATAVRSVDDEPLGGTDEIRFFTVFGTPGFLPTADQMRISLGRLNVGRQGHRATLLVDGRVLITGGFTIGGSTTDSAEVYVESLQRFTELANPMVQDRASHSATRLADGRVLLAGGWYEGSPGLNAVRSSAEVFDPATNEFSAVGSMGKQRTDHAAALLPDGRVLITGGSRPAGGSFFEDLDDAELFDPVTNTFAPLVARMTHTRSAHGLVAGPPGTFILAGGSDVDFTHGRFQVSTLSFANLGPTLGGDRGRFGPATAAFDSGGVVIAGGDNVGTVVFVRADGFVLNTGSAMTVGRSYATAVRIRPDQILVAGGIDFSNGGFIESSCDLVVEAGVSGANTFATTVRFTTGMAFHAVSLLPSGDYLFCGGLNEDGSQPNKTAAFVFDVR
ncbi:MAG: Ig-like domain-containing protein [Planctomycetota bacterium]|nr:Ig-like domain-containing protein [Planctomycetota bacterium]